MKPPPEVQKILDLDITEKEKAARLTTLVNSNNANTLIWLAEQDDPVYEADYDPEAE